MIVGGVRDEGKLFFDTMTGLTADQYENAVDTGYGPIATTVMAHYPLRDYPTPFYARAAVFTDSLEACPDYLGASGFASQAPTWEEEFDDLAFLWNFTLIAHPLTPAEQRLGMQMDRYWAAFARTGNPNVQGQVSWPRVTPSADHFVRSSLNYGGPVGGVIGRLKSELPLCHY